MHRYSATDKLRIIKLVLEGNHSVNSAAISNDINEDTLRGWLRNYQSIGVEAFYQKKRIKRNSTEKENAVLDYLSGKGSLRDICRKYKISDTHTLRNWISLYNAGKKLNASRTGESRLMTKGRKTTFEERIEIVQYCIAHDHNYVETSEKYQVSYQQARNYTIKYETGGIDALRDNRGKRKHPDEMSELDRLRAEVRILKAEKERAQMEISFLKKLDEIERRRG